MNATTIDAARIAGAKCCIKVLRQVMQSMEEARKQSIPECFCTKDVAFAEMMALAGPLSPQAAGVFGALVDFALDSLQNGYSLWEQLYSDWQPETAMTADEVRIARSAFAEMTPDVSEADKNVIPFPACSERRDSR